MDAETGSAEKTQFKAMTLKNKADATGNLADTTATMNADMKNLSDLTATCEQKSSDFEARQQLRAEEIVAIQKAIEILSSGSVLGKAEKHLPTFAQMKDQIGNSFAQLRSDSSGIAQSRVAAYLQQRGIELG